MNKKIFIFDDNLEILELCTEILEDLGCEVKTSPTTNNVEQQVNEFMPDLIFMDNWLPDISGIEATRMIKANDDLKNIPVIYFSANSNISELAQEAQADDFLAKPFDLDNFEDIVQKYIKE
ncbi:MULTISPECIES: response regulator [unclassified Kaistella]|uniref:response regulator n=1 Tax=unclassified Kaistella TaxID=2762626 RepID=UPI0027338B83|nr:MULTISPECIES: response regulator [unclassified Kaistella]MDP2453543.1 response regulator [Kaistella sp. SH11-4b]MDP2456600.1 response regulator [Kaistella sp. SH40-3]MDP2459356.1 response regulator [Kaistella sp. SH19-2b]